MANPASSTENDRRIISRPDPPIGPCPGPQATECPVCPAHQEQNLLLQLKQWVKITVNYNNKKKLFDYFDHFMAQLWRRRHDCFSILVKISNNWSIRSKTTNMTSHFGSECNNYLAFVYLHTSGFISDMTVMLLRGWITKKHN